MQTGGSGKQGLSPKEESSRSQLSDELYTRTGSTEHNDYRIKGGEETTKTEDKEQREKNRNHGNSSETSKS